MRRSRCGQSGPALRSGLWSAQSDPVILPIHRDAEGEGRPVISVVIISRDDEDRMEHVVRAAVDQDCPDPFEVIVVTSGTDRTADILRRRFPAVRLVELDHPALPGEARTAGRRLARGDFVAFPGSTVAMGRGSLRARLAAHDSGYALVSGAVANGTDTLAGWASYFLDHSASPPLPARDRTSSRAGTVLVRPVRPRRGRRLPGGHASR
jgi:hypothetical protein